MEDRGTPRVRELDLRDCKVSSTVDGINVVRGLKCSAAFFTFLRANLALSSSMMASPASTPQLDPITAPADSNLAIFPAAPAALAAITTTTAATPSKPASSSSAPSTPGLVPLDDIPDLSLDVLRTEDEQKEGLELLAGTVAGMRTPATVTVMSHPSCLVPFTTFLSVIYYTRYTIPGHFKVTACCTYGSVLVYVLLIWCLARPYKTFAKDVNRAWLDEEGPNRDIMVGARGRDRKLAGVVVLRLSPKLVPTGGRRRTRSLSFKGGRGLIRAWAVRRKSRGRGVGKELLQEAVRITRDRCGKDADIGFVQDHAHSKLVFHNMFNGFFHKVEIGADKALRTAVSEWSATKKRRNK
ncbi:GCN5-related N-acetyltransferase [Cordyceps javanica]|uniref:GCN5-related N-acetyltransferase n=1 Tax=Cordyceps javanica TaxID=43265 RepID=A0A545V388_9HYPO|nr:GCN5-related N-acetyltransferase [Cordyceps javanica]TQW07482.1 GCN5-related N-acetyltransferase [Cordyceps javanica]